MKSAFVNAFLGVVVLLSAVTVVSADETLKYELTPEKVEKASVSEIEGSYYIHVKLKEPYVKEFLELTSNNIGKRLEIIFSGRIFSAAVIRIRVESGRIRSNKLSSEEDAKRIMKALNEYNDDIEVPAKKDKQNEKNQAIAVKKRLEELARDRDIVWAKTFGGESTDWANSVRQTTDGGYIVAGYTSSYGSGSTDVYLLKTDSSGNEEWSKTFGGKEANYAFSVQQTKDGGYVIAGDTDSYGSGSSDVYLIKTDPSGKVEWSKAFSREKNDAARSVQQTTDGGYIIAGSTSSHGSGQSDVYLVKTDSSGNEEWSKTFGGELLDLAISVQLTPDGGYIVAGSSIDFMKPDSDIYLIKTDPSGNEEWSKTLGGKKLDIATSVQQTKDGGYIIVGVTRSYGNDFTDILLIKLAPKLKKKPGQK